MRVVRSFGVAGLCCALLGGCAGEVRAPAYYVVRADDTLYDIAWRNDVDYRELAAWNHIGPDYRLQVGQWLWLHPIDTGHGAPSRPPRRALPAAHASAPAAPVASAAGEREDASLQWAWPTARIGAPRRLQNGALLIIGKLGQDVRAAAAGRVVYTGSGIRGFGKLVIIKHSAALLSAYGYNQDVLVHDNEQVATGQPIASMGEGLRRTPTLYFEIRLDGHSVDALPYLPDAKRILQ